MTNVVMSEAMDAWLRALTARGMKETAFSFDQSLSRTQMPQPMNTLNKAITFRIKCPVDGTREFTLTTSLQELSTTTTTPTAGYDVTSK